MFGAFGLLSIGLIYMVLRYIAGDQIKWNDKLGIWAFWLYNIGLVLWVILNFFPVGWTHLAAVYEHGYAYARNLGFYDKTLLWQWLRLPGNILFAIGAILRAIDFIFKTRSLWIKRIYVGASLELKGN
jgi:nitric oxide reductase subunit B